MINFLKNYKNNYKDLTKGEKKILEFIGKFPQKSATLSALDLGKEIGVSDASIIRLSKSIGFKGFSDLKSYIIKELGNTKIPSKRIEDNWYNFNTNHDIVNKMVRTDLRGLETFLKEINLDDLDKAVSYLEKKKKIYIMGIGASRAVAQFLSWHMKRMMFDVKFLQDGGVGLYEELTHISKDNVLLIITFPGTLTDEIKAVKMAKLKKAKVITVTGSIFSEISFNSDIVFKVNVEGESFFNSYVVVMEFCNILLMALLEQNKEKIHKELKNKSKEMEFLYVGEE